MGPQWGAFMGGSVAVSTALPAAGSRAEAMLMKVVAHLRSTGSVDISLRHLAAAIGTSHRMLQYHFGTRENLLGIVMMQLSKEYIAHFSGKRPTTRVETIEAVWTRFLDPSNRLQTQILFALSAAVAERPDLEAPGLTADFDNFAAALGAFGRAEGLEPAAADREARAIVSSLLGLYLDFFVLRDIERIQASFDTLKGWVQRSTADASHPLPE
jgi:AcrR family transcriptional regulator